MPDGHGAPSRILSGRIPASSPGMRIGLFGGSFNPAHEGHRHVALMAMKRLGLDQIWWLVTPGNPLKDNSGLPDLHERLRQTALMAAHPRMIVTDVEALLGTRYTVDTIRALKQRLPGRHLVFVLGADNWSGFHRWAHWRDLLKLVPVAVPDRPGSTMKALNSPAAKVAVPRRDAAPRRLLAHGAKGWAFLGGRKMPVSSTEIRRAKIRTDISAG